MHVNEDAILKTPVLTLINGTLYNIEPWTQNPFCFLFFYLGHRVKAVPLRQTLVKQNHFVQCWGFLMSVATDYKSMRWNKEKKKGSFSTRQGQTGIKFTMVFCLVRQNPNEHTLHPTVCVRCQVYRRRSAPAQIYCAAASRPGQHPALSKSAGGICGKKDGTGGKVFIFISLQRFCSKVPEV